MPTTLIFGGSGKVARHLARILAKEHRPAHTVYSVIRNADQTASLEAIGARPIVQSIEESSIADFVATIVRTKPDFVVWSAGAGGGSPARTKAVDQDGAIKAMDALAEASEADGSIGKRFIMVSAIDVRDRSKGAPSWYSDKDKEHSDKVWSYIGTYMDAKLAADISLRSENERRGLEYTIVRPGMLSLESGTGRVRAGKVALTGAIPREDVARVVVAVIENEKTAGLAFDVMGDGDGVDEIDRAIARVADANEDAFEGNF
jgi:nucleoside-diphosphate-sugar epimerase